MATSMMSRVFVLFLIILPLLVVSSEARFFPKFPTNVSKKINSELLLRDIVNKVRNSEYHRKRSMMEGRLERLSPAGPDPQHH
ncbi:hypothetical protein VNO77_28180 [Canavalia gladiata]|uniref:Uncharacterized protein n=1 Tax=Canavalia gladiata TaxID=3824 RepID=A0AAN9KWH6_CANGL